MAIAQFRGVASSTDVRTKKRERKEIGKTGKAVVEKPLQLLQVMLLDQSHLTGTKPFAAQLRLDRKEGILTELRRPLPGGGGCSL